MLQKGDPTDERHSTEPHIAMEGIMKEIFKNIKNQNTFIPFPIRESARPASAYCLLGCPTCCNLFCHEMAYVRTSYDIGYHLPFCLLFVGLLDLLSWWFVRSFVCIVRSFQQQVRSRSEVPNSFDSILFSYVHCK